jgi:hypothetical protein
MHPPPAPAGQGAVFLDARDDGRALRVTAHPEADLVVLSCWRGHRCVATFRLAAADTTGLVQALAAAAELLGPAEGVDRGTGAAATGR